MEGENMDNGIQGDDASSNDKGGLDAESNVLRFARYLKRFACSDDMIVAHHRLRPQWRRNE